MSFDRRLLKKYFTNINSWAYILIIVGILLGLTSILIILTSRGDSSTILFLFGIMLSILFLGVGGWMVYDHFHLRPDDGAVSWLIGIDLEQFHRMALAKLGLTDEEVVGNYIYLWGPTSDDLQDVYYGTEFRPMRFRKGRDGLYRFSEYNVTILLPTTRYLAVFKCLYRTFMDRPFQYWTGEYFYNDVVSVQTNSAMEFALSFSDGNRFSTVIPSDSYSKMLYQSHHVPFVSYEKGIQSIRKMIQAHKA